MEDNVKAKPPARMSVKIPTSVHKDVNIWSANTGEPIYSLLEAAWELYKHKSGETSTTTDVVPSKDRGVVPADPSRTPSRLQFDKSEILPSHSEWISVLLNILRSGHVVAIEAITSNLRAFDTLIHADNEGRHAEYEAPSPADLADEKSRAAYHTRLLKTVQGIGKRTERRKDQAAG